LKSGFEYLEHTSDVLVRAFAETINEAFEQAGKALIGVLVQNPRDVSPSLKKEFVVSGDTLEELLYRYLEELIYLFDTERLLFSRFNTEVRSLPPRYECRVTVFGEKLDTLKHRPGIEVKAVTYHMMNVVQLKTKSEVTFLLDI